jgi:hypothetical protein
MSETKDKPKRRELSPELAGSIHEAQLKKLADFPPVFYDMKTEKYWFFMVDEWCSMKKGDLRGLVFRDLGLRDVPFIKADGSWDFKEIDWPINHAFKHNKVHYAGSMAGWRMGVMKRGPKRYLVTDECNPEIWEPKEKDYAVVDGKIKILKKLPEPKWFLKFVAELLPDYTGTEPYGEQGALFLFWLGVALESLILRSFVPGQLVVMAGDSGCGKSLMQAFITEVLGGRESNPFKFLKEGKFTGGLNGAEHWPIADPDSTTDMKTRRVIGTKLKQCLVNGEFEVELKGKDALGLKLQRRLSLTVNKEPENLAVVPPMDKSMLDKVFLFSCGAANVGSDRLWLENKIAEEAPMIRNWLLRFYCEAKIPPALRDRCGVENSADPNAIGRMKIAAWQHPELMEILSGLSLEAKLKDMIDQGVFKPGETALDAFSGMAKELEAKLRACNQFSDTQLDKIFPWPSQCGTLLDRLHRDFPERFIKVKAANQNGGKTIWRILPPSNEEK